MNVKVKKVSILICVALIMTLMAGCAEIVSQVAINAEYLAAYDTLETKYVYKYDVWNGEFKYLPEVKMVHHPEEWRVQYERVWSDGTKDTRWKTVSKSDEQDRLYFFVDQVSLAQKKYDRLFKTFKDAPYLSEGTQFLGDAGRELQFYKDIVEMLDKGYRKQSEPFSCGHEKGVEWISVDEALPESDTRVLVYMHENRMSYTKVDTDRLVARKWVRWDNLVTHWMPLPEPPKMKGGEADA